jgi:hypothetical protein
VHAESAGLAPAVPPPLCLALSESSDETVWSKWSAEEWARISDKATKEGVAPLLCQRLDAIGWPDSIPQHVTQELRRSRFATAANSLLILGELQRILDAFAFHDLQSKAVVMKGADLALSIYPSVALRPMCDLDMLLPKPKLSEALDVLRHLGYRATMPEIAVGHSQLTGHAVSLLGGPRRSVAVELHWGLVSSDMDRRSPSLGWFWDQTENWNENGVAGRNGHRQAVLPESFLHLKPTAHLLYLAAHIALQHGMEASRLLWFYDIHLLITREGYRIDWAELRRRADELRWNSALAAALSGAKKRFGTAIPDEFLRAVVENIERHLPGHDVIALGRNQPRSARIWNHQLRGMALISRLAFIWNHCFPTASYIQWRYHPNPSWLWPLYYGVRWITIAKVVAGGVKSVFLRCCSLRKERSLRDPECGHEGRLTRGLREIAGDGALRLNVNGNCMAPWVRNGDVVEVKPAKLLLPGDVVAIRQNGRIRLHRLIGVKPQWRGLKLVTQGDGNRSCDMLSEQNNVIGKVSGGECSPHLVRPPLRHRLQAVGRFCLLVLRRLPLKL